MIQASRTLLVSLRLGRFWPWYLGLTLWVYLCLVRPLSEWRATGWLVDYSMGWVKRGLPGQVLETLGIASLGLTTLTAIATGLALLFALGFGQLLSHFHATAPPLNPDFNRVDRGKTGHLLGLPLLLWVSVLAPFTLQQALHDLGRYDLINWTLALGFVLALLKTPKAQWLALLIYPCLPLIHEASLMLCVPTLSVLWLVYLKHHQRNLGLFLLSHIAFAASLGSVLWLGGVSADQISLFQQQLAAKAQGFEVVPSAVQVYQNEVAAEAQATLPKLHQRLGNLLLVALLLLPFIGFSVQAFQSIQRQRWHALLPLAALAPLPLFVIGVDFFRWLSAIVLQLWLVLLGYAVITEQTQALLQQCEQRAALRRNLWLQLVLCLYIGPIGVSTFLPERGALLQPKLGWHAAE